MNKYKVLIQGHNLLMGVERQIEKYGFYTTRFVEAYTADSATEIALDEFVAERKWQDLVGGLRNARSDPPRLTVERSDIEQLDSFDYVENRYPGYALYKEDGEESDM